MKKIAGLWALAMTAAGPVMAGGNPSTYSVIPVADVPEVGTTGALAAVAGVAAVGVMAWERRRRSK